MEIARHTLSGEVFIEMRGAGDLIGELAAMRPGSTRSVTVTAQGHDMEAYCFSMAALDALQCKGKFEVWRGLAVHVAAKLARSASDLQANFNFHCVLLRLSDVEFAR